MKIDEHMEPHKSNEFYINKPVKQLSFWNPKKYGENYDNITNLQI